MEKEKLSVAKEIIEKSYIKLKNYKENNVEFNEFSINTDIKNVISKKSKNYPLDKDMDNLTISTWKKIFYPKLMDINIIYHV